MFYTEICPRLGNGLEGRSKASSKNLRILIYGCLNHIHIHGGIFWVKTRKIYQFSTCEKLTYLSSSVTMVNLHGGPQAWRRPQIVFFIFISFLYWKTNSRERSQLCKKRERSWYPRRDHPECTRINDNWVWQHPDHKRWSHPRKCFAEENKISRVKKKKKQEKKNPLMSEIYIVQAFPPINFGSPWVFPGKFNLRVSEPFTLTHHAALVS